MTGDDKTEKKTAEPFLARWARVKRDQTQMSSPVPERSASNGIKLTNASIDEALQPKMSEEARAEPGLPNSAQSAALPSLDSLTPQSDFSPFMAKNVDTQLRNQAMKKLFADPHYNVMDRLDIYIDDYSIERPLSIDVIRQMSISKTLGLFDDEEKSAAGASAATESMRVMPPDENTALPTPLPAEATPLLTQDDRAKDHDNREPQTEKSAVTVTNGVVQTNR